MGKDIHKAAIMEVASVLLSVLEELEHILMSALVFLFSSILLAMLA